MPGGVDHLGIAQLHIVVQHVVVVAASLLFLDHQLTIIVHICAMLEPDIHFHLHLLSSDILLSIYFYGFTREMKLNWAPL